MGLDIVAKPPVKNSKACRCFRAAATVNPHLLDLPRETVAVLSIG